MNTKFFGTLQFEEIMDSMYGINGRNLCWGSQTLSTHLIKDELMDEIEALELVSCYYEV